MLLLWQEISVRRWGPRTRGAMGNPEIPSWVSAGNYHLIQWWWNERMLHLDKQLFVSRKGEFGSRCLLFCLMPGNDVTGDVIESLRQPLSLLDQQMVVKLGAPKQEAKNQTAYFTTNIIRYCCVPPSESWPGCCQVTMKSAWLAKVQIFWGGWVRSNTANTNKN